MKVLLISINAKYIHTNNAVRLLKANSDFPIEILEYTIKDDPSLIIDNINKSDANVVGFSCYIWNITIITSLLEHINSEKIIILGGPEVSYESKHFIHNYPIDYIVKGEGEISFNRLLHAIELGSGFEEVTGLTYQKNDHIYDTDIVEIADLATITPAYFFEEDIEHIPNKIAYIESSRGCPYHCSYCLSSLEKTVRFFPVESVKEAILYLLNHGSKTIKFLDRTFNANKNTLDILQFIIEHNNNQTVFQFEITGDILSPDIINYINNNAPSGLFRFEIGIQSINYDTNFLVDRFQDTDKLFSNIRLIQNAKIIDLHLDLIAGLPQENLESFKNTFDEVFRLGAKELQLGFLKMLRGTKIRIEADKHQYTFSQEAPYQIISNNVLSKDDVALIHDVEHMLELYHNKGYFMERFHQIILNKPSPFAFFEQLAKLYKTHNYSMHGYQVDDVYQRVFPLLSPHEQYLTKQDYLLRSNIKPKLFFETIKDKVLKQKLFTHMMETYQIDINVLYKYSVVIHSSDEYFIILYHPTNKQYYTIKEDIINK